MDMPGFPDIFQLMMQAELGVAPLESRLSPELLEQPVVEPKWRKLRVGQIQNKVLVPTDWISVCG